MIDILIAGIIVLMLGIPFVMMIDSAKKEMEAEDANKGGEADV